MRKLRKGIFNDRYGPADVLPMWINERSQPAAILQRVSHGLYARLA